MGATSGLVLATLALSLAALVGFAVVATQGYRALTREDRITRRYRALAPIVDTEYGSATFVSSREPATYELRVSTTGLLARRTSDSSRASR